MLSKMLESYILIDSKMKEERCLLVADSSYIHFHHLVLQIANGDSLGGFDTRLVAIHVLLASLTSKLVFFDILFHYYFQVVATLTKKGKSGIGTTSFEFSHLLLLALLIFLIFLIIINDVNVFWTDGQSVIRQRASSPFHSFLFFCLVSHPISHLFSQKKCRRFVPVIHTMCSTETDLPFPEVLENERWSRWKILLLGQAVALCYAGGSAVQSSMKLQCDFSAPTLVSGLMYALLAVLYLAPLCWKRRQTSVKALPQEDDSSLDNQEPEYKHRLLWCIPLEGSPKAYFIMALVDLEALYFTVLAFRYTTLVSVVILGSLATPAAMFFSHFILKRRYARIHLAGVFVCMAGTGFNLLLDLQQQQEESDKSTVYGRKLLGDLFAIIGATAFGLSDVICEKAVTEVGGSHEYLGCVGLFAACIAFFQAALLEREEISQFVGLFRADTDEQECPAEMSLGLLLLFLAFHVLGYYTSTKFLEVSESALLNLSILTENVWSVIFSILVQHLIPSPFFYGALIFTVGGVYIYETAPPPIVHDDEHRIEEQDGVLEMQRMREDQKRGYAKASTSSESLSSSSDEII